MTRRREESGALKSGHLLSTLIWISQRYFFLRESGDDASNIMVFFLGAIGCQIGWTKDINL